MNEKLRRQFQAALQRGDLQHFPALLGDGTGNISVSGRSGYVYVRIGREQSLGQAFNQRVPLRENLPVIVGYTAERPDLFQILSLREVYVGAGYDKIPQVVAHHASHEIHNEAGGDDVVWVQKQQVVPMLCLPTDPVSMQVVVLEDWYPWATGWHYFAGATSANLSGYVPSLSGQARFVLISIDGATNALQYTTGDVFVIGLPLENIDVRVPAPPLGSVPVCAVYFTGTTTYLGWDSLYDLRLFNSPGAGSLVPYPDLWENVIIIAKSGGEWMLVQDGLDAADSGDTVLVMPGSYAEDLTQAGTNVTLLGLAAKHITGPYGALISGDAAEVGPVLTWGGSGTLCSVVFNRELTLAGGGFTILLVTGNINIIDCRFHISEGATGRNVLSLSVGGAGDTIDISRCDIISPGASSPTAVSLNGGTVVIADCDFSGDVICTAATQVTIRETQITGDLTGVAGSDLVLTNSVVTGAVTGWDSVTYHGLSSLPPTRGDLVVADGTPVWEQLSLGVAHQLLKVNAGATDPAWSSFDWDEVAAAAAADMAHDHSSGPEGGVTSAHRLIWIGW